MDFQALTPIVYPTLAASLFAAAGMLLTYGRVGAPRRTIWAAVLFLLCDALSVGLLGLASGQQPLFAIAELRPWIIGGRVGMLLSIWWLTFELYLTYQQALALAKRLHQMEQQLRIEMAREAGYGHQFDDSDS